MPELLPPGGGALDFIVCGKNLSLLSLHAQEKALATPRRPCSPEGRCARARPQHVSAASYGRPEHILPGHLGPVGAPRGGRRHAASIWGSRRPSSTHGRVAPRPTIWRRTDAPRPRIRTRLRRAAGHRPAPHRATAALQHEARSRHNIDAAGGGHRHTTPTRRRAAQARPARCRSSRKATTHAARVEQHRRQLRLLASSSLARARRPSGRRPALSTGPARSERALLQRRAWMRAQAVATAAVRPAGAAGHAAEVEVAAARNERPQRRARAMRLSLFRGFALPAP